MVEMEGAEDATPILKDLLNGKVMKYIKNKLNYD